MHLIPRDKDLWKIDRFEDFIEERKRLIKAKFSYLLSQKAFWPAANQPSTVEVDQ